MLRGIRFSIVSLGFDVCESATFSRKCVFGFLRFCGGCLLAAVHKGDHDETYIGNSEMLMGLWRCTGFSLWWFNVIVVLITTAEYFIPGGRFTWKYKMHWREEFYLSEVKLTCSQYAEMACLLLPTVYVALQSGVAFRLRRVLALRY